MLKKLRVHIFSLYLLYYIFIGIGPDLKSHCHMTLATTTLCGFLRLQSKSVVIPQVNKCKIKALYLQTYLILKGQSYENVCEIIALNDRLDSN
jgi:hypothetical protein